MQSTILETLQRDASVFTWATYELVFDSPDKSLPGSAENAASITTSLKDSVNAAQMELLIITPYLVLRDPEIVAARRLREKGIKIAVLTNSLASNNHTVSHSGYIPVRKPLLEMGVIIDSTELAGRFAYRFHSLQRNESYELFLNEDGALRWRGHEDGLEVILNKEPQTGFWQRFSAGFLRTLPIKSQL